VLPSVLLLIFAIDKTALRLLCGWITWISYRRIVASGLSRALSHGDNGFTEELT
jgi:hypothetical protein